MKEDELSNQLKSQNLDTVLPSSLKQVGGAVFPDVPTVGGLAAYRHVVDSYRAVHLTAYGQSIPGSFAVVTVDGSENILSPGTNQVARIQTLTLTNAGGAAPIAIQIKTGTALLIAADVGPGETLTLATTTAGLFPIFIDKNIPLSVSVTGGAATDLTTECVYSLTSQ